LTGDITVDSLLTVAKPSKSRMRRCARKDKCTGTQYYLPKCRWQLYCSKRCKNAVTQARRQKKIRMALERMEVEMAKGKGTGNMTVTA
jgi:hypothetical protein